MQLAWTIAALSRSKKLPKLENLLGRPKATKRPKKQTWKDMLKVAEGLAARRA